MPEKELAAILPVLNHTRHHFFSQMLIETAGLFWIFAELCILLGVLAGRDHLERNSTTGQFVWTPRLTTWALGFGIFFAALLLAAYGRHFYWKPVHVLLQQTYATVRFLEPDDAVRAFRAARFRHQGLWAFFVTIWVLLEVMIVYHGWRGYRLLRVRLKALGVQA
jgi:hypothetical protein